MQNITAESIMKKYNVGPGDDGYVNALKKESEFLKNKNQTRTQAKNNLKNKLQNQSNQKEMEKKEDSLKDYEKEYTDNKKVLSSGLGGILKAGFGF